MSTKPEESEEEKEEQGEEAGEEETQEAGTIQKAPVATLEQGIKLVINIKGNRAVVGVQAQGCDPVLATTEGRTDEILIFACGLLRDAQETWKKTPMYPKSDLPQPAPAPVSTSRASTPSPPKAAAGKKPDPINWKPLF